MATLALSAAGAVAGSALLPSGLTVFGTTIAGATIGSQVGALAGAFIDQALFAGSAQGRSFEGPRLGDLHVMASSEGAPIPKLYGRARLGGQVIWATDYEEVVTTEVVGGSGGGKGLGSPSSPTTTQTTYSYFGNFAVAICEGEVTALGRIWADGEELDLTNITYRFYRGSQNQSADSLIVAREGAANTPAYRGVAYIVFERLALAPYGNRLPQLSFEIYRSVDEFHKKVQGAVIIPGAGEFVYSTAQVTRDGSGGARLPENVNTKLAATNWAASMDQLQTTLPGIRNASLVVSWFGNDLRAGNCELRPGVEIASKITRPLTWNVAGVSRAEAYVVSTHDGRPAYGGTPSDQTVVAAIKDLKARGIGVGLTPFIMMDIPAENALPDPYTMAPAQPVYPWRGRITCDPAPGVSGSPDKTAEAAAQLAAFIGTAQVSDFSVAGESVRYSGPDEWGYRRFILHHAHLAKAAGGVDTFVIGSELRGLTWVRDSAAHYPFVDALVQLAGDAKTVLGAATKVTYAADWSEYFGHHPADGSGDIYFHLDPLWASAAIDAVGIDLYWPLSDWRAGGAHLDAEQARSIYDLEYLKANITAGEGYDWYYASQEDRDRQVRTPITDGGAGKPWVFRYKDIKSWWQNPHFNRPGGIENAEPTAWMPEAKPIWIMETGCPAVDKGANQPNVFYDPKSSENFLPYYAKARRDDFMQRRYLQALIEGFDPEDKDYVDGRNPVSAVYGGRMVDLSKAYVYAWDARPFPAFPADEETWGDAPNWRFGHWLNGRFANLALNEAVRQILADYDFKAFDVAKLDGSLPGYVIDRIMAAREALQPLELAYFFDTLETAGLITARHRGQSRPVANLTPDGAVEQSPGSQLISRVRMQETDLPAIAKVRYVSASGDYRGAVSEARRASVATSRVAQADLAMMLEHEQAGTISESWLHETWAARDTASFVLPPSSLAIEPGDLINYKTGGQNLLYRITSVGDRGAREIEARSIDPGIYQGGGGLARQIAGDTQTVIGPADALFLDLPLLRGDEPETAGYIALSQTPWPGDIAIYRSPEEAGFVLQDIASVPAVVGTTLSELPAGPEGRLDKSTRLTVQLAGGALQSVSALALWGGANAAAVRNGEGEWEVLQFQSAELTATQTYDVSGLLRGQAGTETAMQSGKIAAGAPFVLIDTTLLRLNLAPDQLMLPLNWRYGPAQRDIGHVSFNSQTHAFSGLGRRPLSPVHVRGSRSLSGDLTITWIRRTRIGGDSWDVAEVPLAEEREEYSIDIMNGGLRVRTLSSTAPSALYSEADQIQDFGALADTVNCVVYQISATWGRGAGRMATI